MIQFHTVSKRYPQGSVFDSMSFQINEGERLGIVGPNGSGKSTLFRLILGEEEPDSGTVSVKSSARIGYLPQEIAGISHDGTILSEAMTPSRHFQRMESRRREIEHELAQSAPGENRRQLLNEYQHHQEHLEHEVGYVDEIRAKTILKGLGFHEEEFERPLKELSGGYAMRGALARLLIHLPDVLLLDEPTNHLDLHSVIWMKEFLADYSGTLLLISHDRSLLNHLVTEIVDIENENLARYKGGYDDFIEARALKIRQQQARAKNIDRRRAEVERFIERFRYKNTRASLVQSRIKMLNKMESLEVESESKGISFDFPQPPRGGKEVLALENLHKRYGERTVYSGINLTLYRGQRMAIVGPNGAGKSTLIKIMAGELPFEEGERRLGHNITLAYYSQHRPEMFQPENTVLEEMQRCANADQTEEYLRTFLGVFLFSGDDIYKPVAVLSGGEKSRLALARIMLDPPNLLLFDEPTTHLDIHAREALEAALDQYQGTICFISHDETFIRYMADCIAEVGQGGVTIFPGRYDEYLDKKRRDEPKRGDRRDSQDAALTSRQSNRPDSKSPRSERDAPTAARRRRMRARMNELEREIESIENERKAVLAKLQEPNVYKNHFELQEVQEEADRFKQIAQRLMREWEELVEWLDL